MTALDMCFALSNPVFIITLVGLHVNANVEYDGSFQGFAFMPNDIPSTVDSVDLSWNNIKAVTTWFDFSQFPGLKYLDMSHNELSDFHICPTSSPLMNLNLTHNNLTSIPILGCLDSLKTLHLDSNEITSMATLKDITKLEFVSLSNNQITSLTTLSDRIKHMNLEFNDIDEFNVNDVTDVKYLFLIGNPIASFDFHSAVQPSVESLSLGHPNYTTSVSNLVSLQSITYLTLSGQFEHLDNITVLGGDLKELILINATIEEINGEFFKYMPSLITMKIINGIVKCMHKVCPQFCHLQLHYYCN